MKECDNRTVIDLNATPPRVVPGQARVCPGCINLLHNPSFEAGIDGWTGNNVFAADSGTFEGTQMAILGTGVASLFQDVSLSGVNRTPLFLSFNVAPTEAADIGSMTAEVLWLDNEMNSIGSGLRLFIPPDRINQFGRLTYYGITDDPPPAAAGARLLFSKAVSREEEPNPDLVALDLVTLAPITAGNRLRNPGFESGLREWTAMAFTPNFRVSYEGTGFASTTTTGSSILQDVPLNNLPDRSSFLLSFAVFSSFPSTLRAQVLWLDSAGLQIRPPGLDLLVGNAVVGHSNYYSYLALTGPAPAGAATARVRFTAGTDENLSARIDEVIFAPVATQNLIQNPGFENGLSGWESLDAAAVESEEAYEGEHVGRIGVLGGVLLQDVPLTGAAGRCYILNFGAGRVPGNREDFPADLLAEVIWLDGDGREIGSGSSLVIQDSVSTEPQWFIYCTVTEPAPRGTAAARIRFAKAGAADDTGFVDIDLVQFGRLR